MKLRQFHNTTFVTYEITETALIVTARAVFRKKTREYLFVNILIKDQYELEHYDKSNLSYITVFLILFGFCAEHEFMQSHSNWTFSIIFAALAVVFIVRFMLKKIKIFIPTKGQGLIHLFQKQPAKKVVHDFMYALEGKVNLHSKKRPEKTDLRHFISE